MNTKEKYELIEDIFQEYVDKWQLICIDKLSDDQANYIFEEIEFENPDKITYGVFCNNENSSIYNLALHISERNPKLKEIKSDMEKVKVRLRKMNFTTGNITINYLSEFISIKIICLSVL